MRDESNDRTKQNNVYCCGKRRSENIFFCSENDPPLILVLIYVSFDVRAGIPNPNCICTLALTLTNTHALPIEALCDIQSQNYKGIYTVTRMRVRIRVKSKG